ncbi:MAG: tetratricopeptide repeat protein [Vulcanimicrobiota bacterium]
MRIFTYGVWLVCVLALFFYCTNYVSSGEDEKVALIAHINGEANEKSGPSKNWKPLYLFTELAAGDSLHISKNAGVRIFFYSDAHSEYLKGDCIVCITTQSCVLKRGDVQCMAVEKPYDWIKSLGYTKTSGKQSLNQKYVRSMNREAWGDIYINKPMFKISRTNPDVEWEETPGGEEYIITFRDEMDKVILRGTSKNGSFSYPSGTQPLSFGKEYMCKVSAIRAHTEVAMGCTKFKVAPKEEIESINRVKDIIKKALQEHHGDLSPSIILLSYYLKNELVDDAFELCKHLSEQKPNDKNLHLWLAKLYDLRGQRDKAEEEQRKAQNKSFSDNTHEKYKMKVKL